jgi:hypothetical protein
MSNVKIPKIFYYLKTVDEYFYSKGKKYSKNKNANPKLYTSLNILLNLLENSMCNDIVKFKDILYIIKIENDKETKIYEIKHKNKYSLTINKILNEENKNENK